MEKFDKYKDDPKYFASVQGISDMCRRLNEHRFIGMEYKGNTRCSRFGLVKDLNDWVFHNHNTGLNISLIGERIEVIGSAECSYATFYIFDNKQEMLDWIDEWDEYTFIADIERIKG